MDHKYLVFAGQTAPHLYNTCGVCFILDVKKHLRLPVFFGSLNCWQNQNFLLRWYGVNLNNIKLSTIKYVSVKEVNVKPDTIARCLVFESLVLFVTNLYHRITLTLYFKHEWSYWRKTDILEFCRCCNLIRLYQFQNLICSHAVTTILWKSYKTNSLNLKSCSNKNHGIT